MKKEGRTKNKEIARLGYNRVGVRSAGRSENKEKRKERITNNEKRRRSGEKQTNNEEKASPKALKTLFSGAGVSAEQEG